MIGLHFKLAFRSLVRNKLYSFLIIGGFAIGFAACILIGLFYYTETTVNNGFANHENIYRLYDVKKNRCNINWNLFPVLESGYAVVEDACPLDYNNWGQLTIRDEQTGNTATVRDLVATTGNFFSIFSVELAESTTGNPFEGRESVSVSGTLARSLFGTQNPVGRQINIGNYFSATVSSVFNELPANSSFSADIILNSVNEQFRFSTTTTNGLTYNPTNLFVVLREGSSPDELTAQLNSSAMLQSLDIDSLSLQPIDDIYLSELTIKSRHAKGNPTLLKIFLAIAALILFLSSINYLNYTVSMQYSKLRVIGIKRTFGEDRKNLIRYAIVEVSLGIMVSLIIALFLADLALSYSGSLFGKEMNITVKDWLAVAPFFLALLTGVVLINSIILLFFLSRQGINEFLSGTREKRNRKQIWKQALLTFQLTTSTALIAVVLIIFKQLDFVNHSDPGFSREHLIRVDIPYKFQHSNAFKDEIRKLPFVMNATLSSGCPGMINHKYGSNTGPGSFDINCILVGDNYLNSMGIELIEGRNFLSGDLNKSCLINQEALKKFGWESIEGKRFNNGQEEGYEVIGVIKDFKFESYHQAVEPLALLLTGAENGNVISVRIRPGETGQQIQQLRQSWKTFSPDEPFSFIFYDDFYQSMYVKEEKLASSITFFSFIAIVLTCMGILGHIFMICLTRVKEIGIRKINGARVSEVLLMLNRDFIWWVTFAILVATPVSYLIMQKWLQNFTYRTSLSWWIFALAGLTALFITLVTVSWQSWKAATRNPVEALRYE